MLSRAATRAVQTPAVRNHLATFGIAASTVWIRSMAKNNRPNYNNNSSNPNSNYSNNNNSNKSANTPSQPSSAKPSGPGVGFTPSHPGARGDKASKIDLSKSHFQKDARNSSMPEQKVEDTPFSEDQPEFNAAKPSENEVPELTDAEQEEAQRRLIADLRHGIPSTWAHEASGAPLADITEAGEAASGGGRGKGELPASAYISSSDKKRARAANYLYGTVAGLAIVGILYFGRNWEDEEEEKNHPDAPSGWSPGLMWKRAKARSGDQLGYYTEPSFKKLLPKPDPNFERPYTLVLSLDDLLIHSEWSREHGWRMAKRPGVDYFVRYLSQYYELVIWTSHPWAIAEPIIRKLDPYHIIQWPLYREATLYEKGEYIKDLSYLNRDLSKVIILDTNKGHVQKQPDNAIVLDKWTGDAKDTELIGLIPFLEFLCIMNFPDVRKAITSFDSAHIPTEFARREAISRAKFEKQLAEERRKAPSRSGLGVLSNTLGIKGGMMSMEGESPGQGFLQGKMLQDQARERAQKAYEEMDKEIRENGEKWLKEEAAMEEAAKQEGMKAMKGNFTGWFGGGSEPAK